MKPDVRTYYVSRTMWLEDPAGTGTRLAAKLPNAPHDDLASQAGHGTVTVFIVSDDPDGARWVPELLMRQAGLDRGRVGMTPEEWAGIVERDAEPRWPDRTASAERAAGLRAIADRRALIALVEEMREAAEIVCLCGDVFTTTETMAEHLWIAHGHEVPPKP